MQALGCEGPRQGRGPPIACTPAPEVSHTGSLRRWGRKRVRQTDGQGKRDRKRQREGGRERVSREGGRERQT